MRHECDRVLGESFEMLVPAPPDFAAAVTFLELPRISLRAGDALHLAVATNHRATRILTLDSGILQAGKRLILPVSSGIRRR